MTRQAVPIVMGVVAAVAAFVVWWALDNSVASALVYGLIAGLLAAPLDTSEARSAAGRCR